MHIPAQIYYTQVLFWSCNVDLPFLYLRPGIEQTQLFGVEGLLCLHACQPFRTEHRFWQVSPRPCARRHRWYERAIAAKIEVIPDADAWVMVMVAEAVAVVVMMWLYGVFVCIQCELNYETVCVLRIQYVCVLFVVLFTAPMSYVAWSITQFLWLCWANLTLQRSDLFRSMLGLYFFNLTNHCCLVMTDEPQTDTERQRYVTDDSSDLHFSWALTSWSCRMTFFSYLT